MTRQRKRGKAAGLLPGAVSGLVTTAKTMVRPAHTAEYPDAPPILPPRSRGIIALAEENCTSCMLCARECPDWCIYIEGHKETIPATTPGGRDRQRNVLDRFAIDFSLCMYCGICIEVCPFDALFWSPQFEFAELDIRDLIHEKDRLGQWMSTVPAPPALDERAADPAEVVSASKPERPVRPAAAGDGPPRAERADRPERPERPERPARADRPERPARAATEGTASEAPASEAPATEAPAAAAAPAPEPPATEASATEAPAAPEAEGEQQ